VSSRIASGVMVSALLRLTEQDGGFATLIARGDEAAGAIIIVLAERGRRVRVLERVLQSSGAYGWVETLAGGDNEAEFDKFLERRRGFDRDSWIVELDTASAERFAAEIRSLD
jgi:hypothetical protein